MNASSVRAWFAPVFPALLGCVLLGAAGMAVAQSPAASSAAAPKVLKIALASRENNFDPAQISDVISAALVASLFDAPLQYDLLARPAKLIPNTAAAMPEVHDNHTRFVFTLRPGIFFPEHPAFGGKPRELVAADYVYSIRRYYDPAVRSPTLFHYTGANVLGMSELREQAITGKRAFDYDAPVAGLQVLDRYRFEIRLAQPAPRFLYVMASPALSGALAREVVEQDFKTIGERPVGTGPFRLAAWTRGTRIVLERNPVHLHNRYDFQPNADDAAGQALVKQFGGRPLPLLDRVELNIIEESQPRWLAFLNGQTDMVAVPVDFATLAAPNGQIAPNLARQGIALHQEVGVQTWYTYFGMESPVVGGYEPHKVALRRAISLAYDVEREIDLVRRGQGIPAQSVLPPGLAGYDPRMKSVMSDHDLPRAKALLDLYGYVDKDGDGWREQPDGSPLELEYASEPHQLARQAQGLWQKSMAALGVRIRFRVGQWQENIKASRSGALMMWGTGWSAAVPDATYFMDVLYGPNKGQSNHARFDLPAFNTLNQQQRVLPDGPERAALVQQALKLSLAYMPIKATSHPINSWLTHPHVLGYRPHPFIRDYWRVMDVNPAGAAH